MAPLQWVLVGLNLLLATALGHPHGLRGLEVNVVDTGYACYQGVTTYGDVTSYLGIPYAEPPLGDLRFRAPEPLDVARVSREAGGSIIDATQYPEPCIQGPTSRGDQGGAGCEDCLKVNIYTPSNAQAGSNLPVLFYIHGGEYLYGNPANWPFDHWVHQSQEVIIVSVYYRLAAFGFLSHSQFTRWGIADHNAGYLDQVQALNWVTDYIHYFGGDPGRITIDGQDAGASSVLLHLTSTGEKVYQQAILQSLYRAVLPSLDQQDGLFSDFAAKAGCDTSEVTDTVACLRQASVSTLSIAQDASYATYPGAYYRFTPVLDTQIITDYPDRLFTQGNYAKVPTIIGHVSDESLAPYSPDVTASDIPAALHAFLPLVTDQDIQYWTNLYVEAAVVWTYPQQQYLTITGDVMVRCASIVADAEQSAKAWTYRWVTPIPGSTLAFHGTDNWYQFLGVQTGENGTATYQTQTPAEQALAEETIAYWLSFVRSGDPNTYKLSKSPNWPQYTTSSPNRILFTLSNDTTTSADTLEVISADKLQRCTLLGSKSDITQT